MAFSAVICYYSESTFIVEVREVDYVYIVIGIVVMSERGGFAGINALP